MHTQCLNTQYISMATLFLYLLLLWQKSNLATIEIETFYIKKHPSNLRNEDILYENDVQTETN